MSWARVLGVKQVRALACLIGSAAPSSRGTGIHLTTMRQLEKLGLIAACDQALGIDVYSRVRVTPAGFRAWADILEVRLFGKAFDTKATDGLAAATAEAPRLPHCVHGNPLEDGAGDALMPSCDCAPDLARVRS